MRLWDEISRDPIFRAAALLCLIIPLVALDMVTGVFGGWAIWIGLGGGAVAWVGWGVFRIREETRKQSLEAELPRFEERRIRELRHRLKEEETFHTPCHECGHFSPASRNCGLHLPGRRMWVKLDLSSSSPTFCLYWNVFAPAQLLRDEDLQKRRL
jgi:hypothetical protein